MKNFIAVIMNKPNKEHKIIKKNYQSINWMKNFIAVTKYVENTYIEIK